jgi:hypothetical protein
MGVLHYPVEEPPHSLPNQTMFDRIRRFFQAKQPEPVRDEAAESQWYEHKTRVMEQFLGKEHDLVMHAIIPYDIGGSLDLDYFPDRP